MKEVWDSYNFVWLFPSPCGVRGIEPPGSRAFATQGFQIAIFARVYRKVELLRIAFNRPLWKTAERYIWQAIR